MAFLLLVAGLVLLTLSGDALVRGAVSAAHRMHVPPIIIGLTVVAMGTSAPELIVSVEAALKGAPGLAIGNVVGSNITNILLVLGLPAVIAPLILVESGIRRSTIFMIAISIGLLMIASNGVLSRADGLMLIGLLALYLVYSGIHASRSRNARLATADLEELEAPPLSAGKTLLLIAFGVVGLGLGGKLTTDGALGVADFFGVADTAVGLTIVALGTSLPELAASIAATLRRHAGVAIGNVVGSNIFNALGILGITALIIPLDVPQSILNVDFWIMLATSALLLPFIFGARRIGRFAGLAMTLAYAAYIVAVFIYS